MLFEDFKKKYAKELADFEKMSQISGAKSAVVQGGGGNTSVKLDDEFMAIKASGYRLGQVKTDDGYAVIKYDAVKDWYYSTNPETLEDVEGAGSAVTKENISTPEGMEFKRPSVEVGFHSLLQKFVLHTHPVFANFATCSDCGTALIDKALEGMDYSYALIPAINPGAGLTFAFRDALDEVEKKTGKRPQILFMMNHGLVATDDDPDVCTKIHDEVNTRIAKAFGVEISSWPEPAIKPCPCGAPDKWISNTPYLTEKIKSGFFNMDILVNNALYPDQLVFLSGSTEIRKTDDGSPCTMACTIFEDTGKVVYLGKETSSLTIEQTLVAIAYIYENVEKAGYNIIPMTEAGKSFIANWESEKYRKSLNN